MSKCLDLLVDKNRNQENIQSTYQAVKDIIGYHNLNNELYQLDAQDIEQCNGLKPQMTDRAYEFELSTRLLIANALDSLNLMRDTGVWYEKTAEAFKDFNTMTSGEMSNFLEKTTYTLNEQLGLDFTEFTQIATQAIKQLDFKLEANASGLAINHITPLDTVTTKTVMFEPQLGQQGRVSVAEFFSPNQSFEALGSTYIKPDCHSRIPEAFPFEKYPFDSYSGVVTGLAALKSQAYQHARRVDELGSRSLRGNDPITAILVIIGVVGAALLIYGIATNDFHVAAFGAVLILGALLVAFGGFALVLAVVA